MTKSNDIEGVAMSAQEQLGAFVPDFEGGVPRGADCLDLEPSAGGYRHSYRAHVVVPVAVPRAVSIAPALRYVTANLADDQRPMAYLHESGDRAFCSFKLASLNEASFREIGSVASAFCEVVGPFQVGEPQVSLTLGARLFRLYEGALVEVPLLDDDVAEN